MTTFTKVILSESVDGRAIKVAATATVGTLIHSGSAVDTTMDEVWLYAVNSDTVARKLTIEWGGTASPGDQIELTIPAEAGLVLVAPGLLIRGSVTPLNITAFCATANVVCIQGYVNQITV